MPQDDMDAVFEALAHRDRRRILDVVKNEPGVYLNQLCPRFDTSRIAVMKHLRVLEAAGLLVARREGRRRRLYHNAVPIQMIYDRWTTEYSALWAGEITRLKYSIEGGGRTPPGSAASAGRSRQPGKKGRHHGRSS